jgi:DNA processing protein
MSPIYSFLFFLSKHDSFFRYQDRILDILNQFKTNDYPLIKKEIEKLNPDLVFGTVLLMQTQPAPFEDERVNRLRYGEVIYPEEFKLLVDPPLVFSYLGQPIWTQDKIAIVGSRHPSQKTLWWLRKELGTVLSKYNLVSVSGGAIGVDQLAHQTSVDLKMPTIAILPSGIRNIYPKNFTSLSEDILNNGGCLLSEFQDQLSVYKHHFSHRNRLIAALGKVSIIVEAREKSGTSMTAHRALEMGKDLFVVPGHPLDESFHGSLQLLKMGAHIMTESADLSYWL